MTNNEKTKRTKRIAMGRIRSFKVTRLDAYHSATVQSLATAKMTVGGDGASVNEK